jgi:uncharacterized protein YndB with AHSA1/START domain
MTITIERTYQASIDDVWDLWTTADGIESWWGPEGFAVTVERLDLRAGGGLTYAMTATAPEQIEFMRGAGMPLTTPCKITYTEVAPKSRLAYTTLADFIPGVTPYEIATIVELQADGSSVHMILTFDAMHDEHWTEMARAGRESELNKLAKALTVRC